MDLATTLLPGKITITKMNSQAIASNKMCVDLKLHSFVAKAKRHTTKALLQAWLNVEAIGYKPLSAAVSADEQSQAKVLTFNF